MFMLSFSCLLIYQLLAIQSVKFLMSSVLFHFEKILTIKNKTSLRGKDFNVSMMIIKHRKIPEEKLIWSVVTRDTLLSSLLPSSGLCFDVGV